MQGGSCLVFLILLSSILFVDSLYPGHNKGIYTTSSPQTERIFCNPNVAYPSIDGSCNNLVNPAYGRAGNPFRRVSHPVYDNNDGHTPRLRAKDGSYLPNARLVSNTVHGPGNHPIPNVNLMVMQWGQFLDHDIAESPMMADTGCCYDELVTRGTLHPDVKNHGACFPIIIGPEDPFFTTLSSRCMSFTRSEAVSDNHNIRQQYSANTPWVDASQIYGSSVPFARSLRSFTGGKLDSTTVSGQSFLPANTNDTCYQQEDGDFCFLAGDYRANVYPGLSALHTIFLRYHNKLCDRLRAIHRNWDDEKLYQVARRIVIAVVQRITYNEFLPVILGRSNAKLYDLLPGDPDYSYNGAIIPTLTNVFSTAAYRFGHSLVSGSLTIGGQTYATGDLFLRPKFVLKSIKDVFQAIIDEQSQQTDLFYVRGMVDRLFESPAKPQSGYDIAALNIQRGRDHGLQPYNDWRERYGLPRKTDFDDLDSGADLFRSVYSSVDDIDLYSGGLSDNPYRDGLIGELYVHIIGSQFKDLKFGDRFWYENRRDRATRFTNEQIMEINKIKLSTIICATVPEFTSIQGNVMELMDPVSNPLVECSKLRDVHIEGWWSSPSEVVG